MAYLRLSFEVVFPIMLFMVVGYCIKLTSPGSQQGFDLMNRMIFRIFLPLKLFFDIVNSDFKTAFQIGLLLFCLIGITLCFLIFSLTVPKLIKKPKDAVVVIQGISRGNYVLFGLSIAANLYPGVNLGVISVISAFTVPFFNISAVILFEFFRGDKPDFKKLAIGVIGNSFVLAAIFAGIMVFFNLRIPNLILKPLMDMSSLATTLALICLGASFSFKNLKKYAKILIASTAVRLAFLPAIFISAGLLMGYRDIELTAIMLMFGAPTAAASYTMAKEMGGNEELAGMITAVTTVTSILTMFLWIFTLKYFQFI